MKRLAFLAAACTLPVALALAAAPAVAAPSAKGPATLAARAAPARDTPARAALPADPLGSPMWAYHARHLFGGDPVVFDPRVIVDLPMLAENQHALPVTVDARALPGVRRVLVFADLNPIPVAVDFAPERAAPFLALRIKLDQRTPVRAAVQTADGTWHVAGGWVDAAGGGCSAPPASRVRGDWADHLGEMRARAWPSGDAGAGGGERLRIALRHPMDTGLVENIPAYHIESLRVASADGQELTHLSIQASVAEDPVFTLEIPGQTGPSRIAARDSSGLEFTGTAAAPARP